MQDKNDEALEKYKQSLLGNIKEEQLKEDEPAEVEIVKIELVCQGRPGGNIQLDFRNHNQKEVRKFTVKEGSLYCMRIHFIVRNDIVFGLKFVNNVYKLLAKGNACYMQSTRTRTRWAALLPRRSNTSLTCPGVKHPAVFWREATTRARDWYCCMYLVLR